MSEMNNDWWIYRGTGKDNNPIDIKDKLPEPPPWRKFNHQNMTERGDTYQPSQVEIELINAALYLRRPILVTGSPGTGKTSLAYAVADELGLGNVLRWSITSNSKLQDGLYSYDAIARLQDTALLQNQAQKSSTIQKYNALKAPDITHYLRLGPLGTALAEGSNEKSKAKPRVLLIDEIDKSDIDLPNNLLHIFEEGQFQIPELARLPKKKNEILNADAEKIWVENGQVNCMTFPLVILTSNGEREFSPAFLRRCLQLEMQLPDKEKLNEIIKAHIRNIPDDQQNKITELINTFIERRDDKKESLATDQLLNAVYMLTKDIDPLHRELEEFGMNLQNLLDTLLHPLKR